MKNADKMFPTCVGMNDVGENGIRDVALKTGMVRARGEKPTARGYIEEYRKGILVYLRQ
jgi:hypothetical protein